MENKSGEKALGGGMAPAPEEKKKVSWSSEVQELHEPVEGVTLTLSKKVLELEDVVGVVPGLQYMISVAGFKIRQNPENPDEYNIFDPSGKLRIYQAAYVDGNHLIIFDSSGRPIFGLQPQFKGGKKNGPFTKISVLLTDKSCLGEIQQKGKDSFIGFGDGGKKVFEIVNRSGGDESGGSGCCCCSSKSDVKEEVDLIIKTPIEGQGSQSPGLQEIGHVFKEEVILTRLQANFKDKDKVDSGNYTITFPPSIEVSNKALLLAATFYMSLIFRK